MHNELKYLTWKKESRNKGQWKGCLPQMDPNRTLQRILV